MARHLLPGAFLALLFLTPLPAPAGPVHEFTLDNGMEVLVREDHRAPVVVSQVWYRVGASYEHGGVTGLSHMLEHMMFKGTERHGPGEFSRLVAAAGGEDNAFTSRDYTAYYQKLAADRLELALRLEADRMRGLLLDPEEFRRERSVVTEERRQRTEDNPQSLAWEEFMAAAFRASPYRQPVIGWMGDIQSYRVEDLRDWYRRWYAPNNAILVVAGDVDPERVHELARRHFGPIEPSPPAEAKPRPEPPQRGERRITVRAPASLPLVIMGYKAPSVGQAAEPWEPYALAVLASVLDGGQSARLARELVRGAEVAASASASYRVYRRLPGLLTLAGLPAQGRTAAAVEEALRAQVQRLREEPVPARELERVKTQVVASEVYDKDSVFYQAMRLGMLEAIGLDWRLDEEYVPRIRAVTPEQVQAVARKYLRDERLTVATLDPLPLDGEGARAPEVAHVR